MKDHQETFRLTNADCAAVNEGDSVYLNQKGARLYTDGDYEQAIEYYRLAAAMGNDDSLSNLGYCYMYARSIPQNMSLALAYFQLAAQKGNIDALYKLGSLYKSGAEGIETDTELSLYYLQKAIHLIFYQEADVTDYPSLFFHMAKEYMPGGALEEDTEAAWQYLHIAQAGYEKELESGVSYHQKALKAVCELLESPYFEAMQDEDDEEDT